MLDDEPLLDRLSRAARPSTQRFAWQPRIREFEELAQRLAGRRAAGHGPHATMPVATDGRP